MPDPRVGRDGCRLVPRDLCNRFLGERAQTALDGSGSPYQQGNETYVRVIPTT